MATTYIVTAEIARILLQTRQQQKKSQSQAARAVGASQTTIQKIEIGQAKESSFLLPYWRWLGLSPERFDELQRQPHQQIAPAAPIAQQRLEQTPAISARSERWAEEMITSIQAGLTDADIGQLMRKIVRENLIRVIDGAVAPVAQGSHPPQIAFFFSRGNHTDLKIVMNAELAVEMARQVLRLVGDAE